MILRGDPTTPKAGDLRIGFRAVPVQALSVIARQAGDGLAAYRAANGHVIDLVHTGAADADSMFRQARADEALLTWILRAVGFVMMLLGVVMMSSPLAWLVSVLPFLRSEEHTSELQSLMRISYAVFCLKKKKQ